MKSTPGIASISRMSMATTRPLPSCAPTRLAATWLQPPGAAPRSTHARAGFEEMQFVVDLDQLVGRARAIAVALGARDIRIVELAFEPERRGKRALLRGLDAHFQLGPPSRPGFCRPVSSWRSYRSLLPARQEGDHTAWLYEEAENRQRRRHWAMTAARFDVKCASTIAAGASRRNVCPRQQQKDNQR